VAGISAGVLILGMILVPFSIEQQAEGKHVNLKRISVTKTVESMQDPGQGHETHQIAILLPPKEGVFYRGLLTFTATTPVEVVVLHDIRQGEKPPVTYTIDGEKKWSLSLIFLGGENKGIESASLAFAGNALALHTLDGTPFAVTVSMFVQERAEVGVMVEGVVMKLAYLGGKEPMTATPIIGEPKTYPKMYHPGTEELDEDEIRITMLGTGMPFPRKAQASAGVLVELGNGDMFLFDIGTGSVANYNSLKIPQADADKVFISHLHTDHQGDLDMLWAQGIPFGRIKPLEVWGPSGEDESLGTKAFVDGMLAANKWDLESRKGKAPTSGAEVIVHEFDATVQGSQVVYDENGVKISAFPALHGLLGAVSYRVDWNDLSFIYSGDTKPTTFMVDNAQNVDLLLHETFIPPEILSEKSGMTLTVAQNVVYGVHTPPRSAGKIFSMTEPRLGAMFHTMQDKEAIAPVFEDLRVTYDGPVVLTQDFTVFNITKEGIVVRQAMIDVNPWPIVPAESSGESLGESAKVPKWLTDSEIPVEGISTEIKGQ